MRGMSVLALAVVAGVTLSGGIAHATGLDAIRGRRLHHRRTADGGDGRGANRPRGRVLRAPVEGPGRRRLPLGGDRHPEHALALLRRACVVPPAVQANGGYDDPQLARRLPVVCPPCNRLAARCRAGRFLTRAGPTPCRHPLDRDAGTLAIAFR